MSSPTSPLIPRQPSNAAPTLSRLLSRAASTTQRRSEASIVVRETAASELEVRRANWGYSNTIVALNIMWDLAFVIVTVVMLIFSTEEKPNKPIRVLVCGYAFLYLVHAVLVLVEFNRRNAFGSGGSSWVGLCESVNRLASFVWWIVGLVWVISGDGNLKRSAPHLYWLAVTFLSIDVILGVFRVVLGCCIGMAICCCLPFIIAFFSAQSSEEADLSTLPKYRYETKKDEESGLNAAGTMVPIETGAGDNDITLSPEENECCICLRNYEDGDELSTLECNHHFHSECIGKWLKINAACPLCKSGGNDQV